MHIMRRERLLKVRQVTHSGKISLKNYKHVRRGSAPVQLEILRQLSFQYRLGSRAICQHFLLLPCWWDQRKHMPFSFARWQKTLSFFHSFFFFTLECHHYLNLPLNVPLNGNVTLHFKRNTQTQKNIILLMHASASESAKASGIHSFLPYWSVEPSPDVAPQLGLRYQVLQIDHTRFNCLVTLLSSSKCSFEIILQAN